MNSSRLALCPIFLWLLLAVPAVLSAEPEEWWISYTNGDRVQAVAQRGNMLVAASSGGLVIWDLATGTHRKVLSPDLWDNSLWDVAVKPDGQIWVATEDADFAWYDGAEWRHLTEADGLPVPESRAILVGQDASVWGGLVSPFPGYLMRYLGGSVETWGPTRGMTVGSINGLARAADGTLWLAANRGLASFDGMTFQLFPSGEGPPEGRWRSVSPGPDGSVWAAGEQGVACYSDGTWTAFGADQGLPSADAYAVLALDGQVWAGTAAGPARWDGSTWQAPDGAEGLPRGRVTDLEPAEGGGIWLGYFGEGIHHWRSGGVVRSLRTGDGLPDNFCRRLEVDPQGIVWVATSHGGLGEFDGQEWRTHQDQGLAEHELRSVNLAPDGTVWAASFGDGFHRLDGEGWSRFTTAEGLQHDQGMVSRVDPQGRVWFGTAYEGVSVLEDGDWTYYDTEDGLSHWRIYWIDFEPPNRVWVTTDSGVNVFDGTRWTSFNEEDGLVFHRCYSMDIDSRGSKWFGCCAGISRFDGQTWTSWRPQDSPLPWFRCNSVLVDRDDCIWIGTGMGLAQFDPAGEDWTIYTPRDGLAGWDVSSVVQDRRGNIWAACRGGGVSCLHRTGMEPPPRVLVGGVRLESGPAGQELVLQAVPWVYDGPTFLRSLELLVGGLPTGRFLGDAGTGGDPVAGDGLYSLRIPLTNPLPSGRYELSLLATDFYGRGSNPWPNLTSE